MSNSQYCKQQLTTIYERLIKAAKSANRNPEEITLVGASKQQSCEKIQQFHCAGLQHFGENYLNEALDKQQQLQMNPVQWHFIGKIQSNKTKIIGQHFDWVHGIDRFKIAQRLDNQRDSVTPLKVLIQVDIDNEASKNGVSPELAPELAVQIAELENLELKGLMVLPQKKLSFDEQRRPFARTRQLLQSINQQYDLKMDTLSMGMSNDLEAAIVEGSTMIRVGTALFGARPQTKTL